MGKIEFDEMQLMLRYKIGYQSFLFLAILIMINVILSGMGAHWAESPTDTFILLLSAFTYFISRCIWCGALIGPKDTPKKFTLKTFLLAVLAMAAAVIITGYLVTKAPPSIPSDGGGLQLFGYCLAMWAIVGIVALVKHMKDKKSDGKE